LLSFAVIALAGWYLTAWLNMPLFPDETAKVSIQSSFVPSISFAIRDRATSLSGD
jgi:hypothetical protein